MLLVLLNVELIKLREISDSSKLYYLSASPSPSILPPSHFFQNIFLILPNAVFLVHTVVMCHSEQPPIRLALPLVCSPHSSHLTKVQNRFCPPLLLLSCCVRVDIHVGCILLTCLQTHLVLISRDLSYHLDLLEVPWSWASFVQALPLLLLPLTW